jgi:hypothetical protein
MPITLPRVARILDHSLQCRECAGQIVTLPDNSPVYRCTVNDEETVLCVVCLARRAVREMPCRVRVRTG